MKHEHIKPGMHVLIRRRPGSAYCDEFQVVDYCGHGRWKVRQVYTERITERDGRAFRAMD